MILSGLTRLFLASSFEVGEFGRNDLVPKQRAVIVIKEACPEREFVQPLRRRFLTVEMNFLLLARKVMSIAVQFESGAPAMQFAFSDNVPFQGE
jgi:hypothetical protein